MSYRLGAREPLAAGLRRIAREQAERALAGLETGSDVHESVHDARKRLKKIRAVLRLVRDDIGETRFDAENAFFRDLGRELAPVRDARVALDTADGLESPLLSRLGGGEPMAKIRARLAERSDEISRRHLEQERRHEVVAAALRSELSRIDEWPIGADRFETIAPGLRRVFRRGRRGLEAAYAEPEFERFHEWRKRAKYLWYHLRILQAAWPEVLGPLAAEVHEVTDRIGVSNDLAELRILLEDLEGLDLRPVELEALTAILDARRAELQEMARPRAMRIWHEKPKRFVDRIGACWRASRGSAAGDFA